MTLANTAIIFITCLTVLNLLLILRVITWLRSVQEIKERVSQGELSAEPEVGTRAPDFSAKMLTGEYVNLKNFLGQSTLFIFFSNECFRCRKEMPMLIKLARTAKARANVNFVLVSEVGVAETVRWRDWLLDEDKVDIDLPFVIAPPNLFDFFDVYNPRVITPYYCLVDEQGIIIARNPIGDNEWETLKQDWEGIIPLAAVARTRYR